MKRIAIGRKPVVLFIAALASTAAVLASMSVSAVPSNAKSGSKQNMPMPDNGPPPFDPTITKDALVQIYREICTNHVKEAAFLFARKIKVNYSSRAFLAISEEMGDDYCVDHHDDALRLKMERFQGIVHEEAIEECRNSRYLDELEYFERTTKLFDEGRYQSPLADDYDAEWLGSYDENYGTNKAYYFAIVWPMRNIRRMMDCGDDTPLIEREAREDTIRKLSRYEDWEAQYVYWFYRMILYNYAQYRNGPNAIMWYD